LEYKQLRRRRQSRLTAGIRGPGGGATVARRHRSLGRIVAEVFVGLAKEDPQSFLNIDPLWQPIFPKQGAQFELRDILRFAGVANNPFP
jgi:hypothetical protein